MKKLVIATILSLLASAPASAAEILKIRIDGVIHPTAAEYVKRAVDEATLSKASALLIEMRTPGGLEASTREIVQTIFSSKVPVIVYVTPSGSRAASAGFFILVSADVAAMAPGTNTGAAHPVILGVEKIDDIMKQKLENDAAAFMRSIATKRGRNVAAAEAAVRQSRSFTEQEALAEKVIDAIATDETQLIRSLNGKTIRRFDGRSETLRLTGPIRFRDMTLRQKVLSFLMDPNVAFILFSLGMLGLWAEFNNPGSILPAVAGGIAILLALFALNVLPTRFAALALVVLAFILFALEAKFVSHGILGAGGILCMTIGALLLVDGPIPELRVQWYTALPVSLSIGVIAIFLMTIALKAQSLRVATGEQGLVGEVGVARTALSPSGRIFVHGELWNAVAVAPISEGASVRVTRVDGLTLEVEPVAERA